MTISKVFIICNAYESGFGHGLKRDGLINPHKHGTDEYEAYNIGYNAGVDIEEAAKPGEDIKI